ncbi:MAG: FAD binding domain-containing protein [Thermomicrobiales bacterium]
MRPFAYTRPESINEAVALLARETTNVATRPRALAGGTDLLTLMKGEITHPDELIDIKRLAELNDTIEQSSDELRIGALATLAQIQDNAMVHESFSALAEAVAVAASPQLRNMATLGGNILQRPRCWYFRDDQVQCWLKGGDDCPAVDGENQYHALFGDSPCHAVHPSDLATALVTLDAAVIAQGPNGERRVPIEAFFALPAADRRTEHTLAADELIVAITLPNRPTIAQSTYLKAMDRQVWAFALVGVGALLLIENQRIADARLVLGGVAPIPWRVPKAESMLMGESPDAALFARVADVALEDATPLSRNGYKIPLAKALIVRALDAAAIPHTAREK